MINPKVISRESTEKKGFETVTNPEILQLSKNGFRPIRYILHDDTIFVETQAIRKNVTKDITSIGGGVTGLITMDTILVESDDIRINGKTAKIQFTEISDVMDFLDNLIERTVDTESLGRRIELRDWLKNTLAPIKLTQTDDGFDETLRHIHDVMRQLPHDTVNKIFDYAAVISENHAAPYTKALETAFELLSE